jgi:hypothetical protein
VDVVGGELGGDPAPREGEARADHRHHRLRAAERKQQVRQHARDPQADEHHRDRQLIVGVVGTQRRRAHCHAEHAEHDRGHREVLIAPGVLAQHPLGEQQQHEQAGGERWLHDDQRREQQRQDLEREAEDREAGAEQPTCSPRESPDERDTQVLVVRGLLGVHRL